MKSLYIWQLPVDKYNAIFKEVKSSLINEGLKDEELIQSLDDAMNSRLYDLQETINISKFL